MMEEVTKSQQSAGGIKNIGKGIDMEDLKKDPKVKVYLSSHRYKINKYRGGA